jgi:hypothetical protein
LLAAVVFVLMFSQGEIVKSKQRTERHELFLMVLFDPKPSSIQFNAVVLVDFAGIEEIGHVVNNWNADKFELSGWDELKPFL